MSQQNKRILVTGFGPFPGASENPGAVLVETMAKAPRATRGANCQLSYEVLPTDWQKIKPALDAAFLDHQPDLALHIGYAANSPGFQLETTAFNETCELEDVSGTCGSCGAITKDSPTHLTTTLPLEKLADRLNAAGLDATCSSDPGRYLCNMAYFLSLDRSPAHSCLFIHIPAIKIGDGLIPKNHEGDNYLSLEEAQRGMTVIIEALAN